MDTWTSTETFDKRCFLLQIRGFCELQRIRNNKSLIAKKLQEMSAKSKTELDKWKSKGNYYKIINKILL